MKKIILIVLTLNFLSCGKSVYYVFDDVKDKDYPSYCSLEITKKKEIIYRASSYKYSSQSYPFSNLYIYIYSDQLSTDIDKDYYRFVSGTSDLFFIKNEFKPKYQHSLLNLANNVVPSIYYRIEENDTIINSEHDFEYLKKVDGFKENGILWFPPYMVKVDKIDYTKFKKSVQHMNLKDPRKQK
jgi:hypothetical protein